MRGREVVTRRVHVPEIGGSNPPRATNTASNTHKRRMCKDTVIDVAVSVGAERLVAIWFTLFPDR